MSPTKTLCVEIVLLLLVRCACEEALVEEVGGRLLLMVARQGMLGGRGQDSVGVLEQVGVVVEKGLVS